MVYHIPPSFHLTIQRTLAHKRSSAAIRKRINQDSDSRISTKTSKSKRAQGVEDVENAEHEIFRLLSHESPNNAFKATIVANGVAGGRVESFSVLHGSPFDPVIGRKHGWESVGELQDTERGNDGGETGEVGNTSSQDKGDGPVDWNESHPQELAGLVGERGEAEKLDEDVVVDN